MKTRMNSNNRILFFHKANDYTGSTRALATLIGKEYASVITISPSNSGFLSDMKNITLIPILYPQIKGRSIPVITFLVSYISRIVQTIKWVNKVDVFYINTIAPFYAAIIGRLFNKRIIYHVHEKIINPNVIYRISEYVFIHIKSDTIYVSEYLKFCYPQKKGDYVIAYNRLPTEFEQNVIVRPFQERNRNSILMVSSLSKEKGVFVFEELAKRLPNYRFTLVLSVENDIIDKSFPNRPANLTIWPKQKNLSLFYHNADLLLNLTQPSACIETFGLTILEAMCYGVPAIVPNVGGPTELVINNYNGYCINVEDISEIMDAISNVFNADTYVNLSNNSLTRYKTLYNNESINSTIDVQRR